MDGPGGISRDGGPTLTVGALRAHLERLPASTPLVIEDVDGRKFFVRAATDPTVTDLPMVALVAADGYSAAALF